MSGPNAAAKKKPSAFVLAHLGGAVRPHKIIDLPLYDADGKPTGRVHIRVLSQREEDIAFAEARAYTSALTKADEEKRWDPIELEHNARASEILSIACRKVEAPDEPFFEHGVVDTREFATEELSQLMNAYNELKEEFYPNLRKLTPETFEQWVTLIAEGAASLPFHSLSRMVLEAFCRSAVMSLVDARATISILTDSSTSE